MKNEPEGIYHPLVETIKLIPEIIQYLPEME